MGRKLKLDLESVLAGDAREDSGALREIGLRRAELLKTWTADPWAFLTGRDLDGRPIWWTKDEDDPVRPVKPFPTDLLYLNRLVQLVWAQGFPEHRYNLEPGRFGFEQPPYNRPIFLEKARQMLITTTILGFGFWDCGFHDARRWILSKSVEDDAEELLRDKIRFSSLRMPGWLQTAIGCSRKPEGRADFRRGSYLLAAGQNVADREARGSTASRVFVDEGAIQERLADILAAVLPMCPRVIVVTTPNLGNPGALVFQKYLE
jgi:hypothetical protein